MNVVNVDYSANSLQDCELPQIAEYIRFHVKKSIEHYLRSAMGFSEARKKYKAIGKDTKGTGFKKWCKDEDFQYTSAVHSAEVYDTLAIYHGKLQDLLTIQCSERALRELAYLSNKEKQAELIPKIIQGEKFTAEEIKEYGYAEEIAEANVANQEYEEARQEFDNSQDAYVKPLKRLSAAEAVNSVVILATEMSSDWKENEVKHLNMLISAYEAEMKLLGVTHAKIDSIKEEVEAKYIDAYNNANYSNNF